MKHLSHKKITYFYIHVPFCRKKCPYCAFYSLESSHSSLFEFYTSALRDEVIMYQEFAGSPRTIYFGGGTPTVLNEIFLSRIFNIFPFHQCEEVTVEGNPESLTPEKIKFLKEAGVTRLSIGVQALDARRLTWLGRIHTASQAWNVVERALETGFEVVSVDFMVGVPGEDTSGLIRELAILTGMGVHHISVYLLTPEPSTPLYEKVKSGEVALPDEDASGLRLLKIWEYLQERGFVHYEVSNFALPGKECLHNTAYWRRDFYLGFGPAASGFLPDEGWGVRYTNVRDVHKYCREVRRGASPVGYKEVLSYEKALLETLFLSLRTRTGIPRGSLERFDIQWQEVQNISYEFEERGFLVVEEDAIRPTEKGMLVADALARRMWEELTAG